MKDETNRRLVFEVAASPDEMSAPDPAIARWRWDNWSLLVLDSAN